MEGAITALSDPNPAMRKSVLESMKSHGEMGAASMGYHEEAFRMLEDRDSSVQVAAISALGSMGSFGSYYADAIVAKMTSSSEKEVKKASIQALGKLGENASAFSGAVEGFLDSPDLDLVVEACISLGSMKAYAAEEKITSKLQVQDVEVVIGACIGLGNMGRGDGAIAGLLGNPIGRIRAASLGSMPKEHAHKYVQYAVQMLPDPDVYVRINAMKLISSSPEAAVAHLGEIVGHLSNPAVGVRVAATAALGGMGPYAESQVEALESMLADQEEDDQSFPMSVAGVRAKVAASMRKPSCAAAAALGALGPEKAGGSCAKLVDHLQSPDFEVRKACATAMGKMGLSGAKYEDQIIALLEDTHPLVVAAACTALGELATSTGTPSMNACSKMAEMIKDKHPAVKGAILGALGCMGEEASAYLEDFIKAFGDTIGYIRAQAVTAVAACGELGEMYAAEVCRMMFDEEVRVRLAALKSLPKMGVRGAAFAEEVASLLEDPVPECRVQAIKALVAFGPQTVSDFMANISQAADDDPASDVKKAAQEAMGMKALEG